ncbi:hypothetical protein ACLOAV_006015 [Pseudogymnoascus australis]
MGLKKSLLLAVALQASVAFSQGAPWSQCGGTGWTGPKTCVSGYTCKYTNDWYSQCIPGDGGNPTNPTTTAPAPAGSPTLYLCGDSTMANRGANDGYTDGWGSFTQDLVSIPVINKAIGGRSARSFTREGRFTEVINAAKRGDYVVIEFGHNDGGSLSTDNGRTPCAGSGEETCTTYYDGKTETVLTYYAYLRNAARSLQAKGVNVIISSPTPNNVWETGSWSYGPGRFHTMSKAAAAATDGKFVDHGFFVADRYKTLGYSAVMAYYPRDHTHTSPAGAKTVAQTFFRGLICGNSGLKSHLSSAGNTVPNQSCGGI